MTGTLRKLAHWIHRGTASGPAYLIVGLGNPGREYAKNRHNAGFQCIEHLARVHGLEFRRHRLRAALAEGRLGGQRVLLAKPLTFMNESGKAVGALSRYYKIPAERILVIHDDLDLPLGKIRLRPDGSSGGHKGVDSLIAELGTRDFARLRIGIGRPEQGDPVEYVLSDFGQDQEPVIATAYEVAGRAILAFLQEGIEKAMSQYNHNGGR